MNETQEKTHEQNISQETENTLELKVQEWKDKTLRLSADFENYKKRQERDRQQFDYFAQRQIILPLLGVVDNLERFKKQTAQIPAELKDWAQGIELVIKDFEKYLSTIGLQPINQLQAFDPELHQAVMNVEQTESPSGSVVEVLEPGYMFKNNVLRPAKVSVAT